MNELPDTRSRPKATARKLPDRQVLNHVSGRMETRRGGTLYSATCPEPKHAGRSKGKFIGVVTKGLAFECIGRDKDDTTHMFVADPPA